MPTIQHNSLLSTESLKVVAWHQKSGCVVLEKRDEPTNLGMIDPICLTAYQVLIMEHAAGNGLVSNDQFDLEEFWDDLLAFIEDGRVIPIVGAELHTVEINGTEFPLYRILAERLLDKYGLKAIDLSNPEPAADNRVLLRPHLELNDAVIALNRHGRRIADLYRPVNDILNNLLGKDAQIPTALKQLASIQSFHLFATTCMDDLLARALDQTRFGDSSYTQRITYAPNLPGEQVRDIPEVMPANYCGVFHVFGRASSSPFFAIDDEDILEFVYNIQAEQGNRPERLLSELRRNHLLLIGCNFADWLSRFFLRLSNQIRLSGDRPEKEFLVGNEASNDHSLTLFLERFSRNTRVYPGEAGAFVTELAKRWEERHPDTQQETGEVLSVSTPAGSGGEIFISYSHTDLPQARVLCAELENFGAGVIWFDKSELHPGDEWEKRIMAALKRCDLFLALVSANTEARTDGYFHTEWDEALSRKKQVLGRTFIVPVVIDLEYDGNTEKFKLVPDRFHDLQFGFAPGGHLSDELRQTLVNSIRDLRRRRMA